MRIDLENITFSNVHELLELNPGNTPSEFVESPEIIIAYAYCGDQQKLRGFCNAICADGVPVGLFLIGEAIPGESDPIEARRAGLFFRMLGFQIDAAQRGKGIAKEALRLILQKYDALYNRAPLVLECHEENTVAYKMYLSAGFRDTRITQNRHQIMLRI